MRRHVSEFCRAQYQYGRPGRLEHVRRSLAPLVAFVLPVRYRIGVGLHRVGYRWRPGA